MFVQQALFTSTQSRRGRGYHLVGQSPGIPDALAERLNHWGPSHDSLIDNDVDAESVSFFPADEGWFILARTGYGGPEYSGRGSLQVVTRILALRSNHLAGFDLCPLALYRTACALGHLRLLFSPPEKLPEVELPTTTYLGRQTEESPGPHPTLLANVHRHLREDGRVAVVNAQHPLGLVNRVLSAMPPEERCWLSFTTGLKPSRHRQFRLNLAPTGDQQLVRQYAAQGISCIR
jgi:GTPase-associated protein 1, N-terminal domain type 2